MSHLRARLAAFPLALAACSALAGGASAAPIDVTVTYACVDELAANAPSEDLTVRVWGQAPSSVVAGERAALTDLRAEARIVGAPGTPPFFQGQVNALTFTATGGSLESSTPVGYPGFFRMTPVGPAAPAVRLERFPSLVAAKAAATPGTLQLRLGALTAGGFEVSNPGAPLPDVERDNLDCLPKPGQPAIAEISVEPQAPTGTRKIDTTLQLTCDGPLAGQPVSLRVQGQAASVGSAGVPSGPSDLTFTLRHPAGTVAPSDPPQETYQFFGGVEVAATGAAKASYAYRQGTPGSFAAFRDVDGIWEQTQPMTAADAVTPAGGAPVTLSIKGVDFSYKLTTDGKPTTPDLGTPTNCTVVGDGKIAEIPVPGAPVSGPAITGVTASAYGGLGGFAILRGTKLGGATTVTVGTRKVRPIYAVGSTEVWVLLPALARGTYPVSVTTATGTSPAGTVAQIRYR